MLAYYTNRLLKDVKTCYPRMERDPVPVTLLPSIHHHYSDIPAPDVSLPKAKHL